MKERFLKYDVMRIFAITMVLLAHISAYIVINYPDPTSAIFFIGNIFNGIRRGAAVPIFLMLTGALMLNEDRKFDTLMFYKKSLMTIIYLLIFWLIFYGVFYAFVLPVLMGKDINVWNFISYILKFKGSDYPHLWYLFMTIGLYLAVPFLRLFVKKENKNYILGFIAASIVIYFIPATFDFLTLNWEITLKQFVNKFHMQYVAGYIAYLLLGWYLANFKLERAKRFCLYILALTAAVASTISVRLLIAEIPDIRNYLYAVTSLHLLVSGAGVFVLISTLCGDKVTKSSIVKTFSNISFGIYIVHIVYLELFSRVIMPYDKFNFYLNNPAMRTLAYILVLFALIYLCSFVTVLVMSKITGVKKLVRG